MKSIAKLSIEPFSKTLETYKGVPFNKSNSVSKKRKRKDREEISEEKENCSIEEEQEEFTFRNKRV